MGITVWKLRPSLGSPHLTPALSVPKGGEGDLQLLLDDLHDACQVFNHIAIPESDYPISVAGNLLRSDFIFFPVDCMLTAIELDG